ncbi:hypothetical protein FGO68_gene9265 [Halteria grandinella]|uniref:Uncharacterized protein n=1 Tax=Halteria grandinella TaxID=5974 RepID=A0A8J8T4V1_HALGN|nr:hypothetical protein FGO68_gene9265 [Halteria grandinella]
MSHANLSIKNFAIKLWKQYKVQTLFKGQELLLQLQNPIVLLCSGCMNYDLEKTIFLDQDVLLAANNYHNKQLVLDGIVINDEINFEELQNMKFKMLIFDDPPQSVNQIPNSLQILELMNINGVLLNDLPEGKQLRISQVVIHLKSINQQVIESLMRIYPTQSLNIYCKRYHRFNKAEYQIICNIFSSTPKIIFNLSKCNEGQKLPLIEDFHYFQTQYMQRNQQVLIDTDLTNYEYEQLSQDAELFQLFIKHYYWDSWLNWFNNSSIEYLPLFMRIPVKLKWINLEDISTPLCQCAEGTAEHGCPLIDLVCEEVDIISNQKDRIRTHMKALKNFKKITCNSDKTLIQALQEMPDAEILDYKLVLDPENIDILSENKILKLIYIENSTIDLETIKKICANKRVPFYLYSNLQKNITLNDFIECTKSKEMRGKVFDTFVDPFSKKDIMKVFKGERLNGQEESRNEEIRKILSRIVKKIHGRIISQLI